MKIAWFQRDQTEDMCLVRCESCGVEQINGGIMDNRPCVVCGGGIATFVENLTAQHLTSQEVRL